jgi:hypothetical protein
MLERMDYTYLKSVYGAMGLNQLESEAKLEQVYLGMTLLRQYHPDLLLIERQVIDSLYAIAPDSHPARLIRRRAADIRNVRDGTIGRENCKLWGELDWSGDKELVEIS